MLEIWKSAHTRRGFTSGHSRAKLRRVSYVRVTVIRCCDHYYCAMLPLPSILSIWDFRSIDKKYSGKLICSTGIELLVSVELKANRSKASLLRLLRLATFEAFGPSRKIVERTGFAEPLSRLAGKLDGLRGLWGGV